MTPAGETLWRYARESLALFDRMQAELGAFADGVQGHVRVFASMSAVAQFLPEDVSEFARKYENVRVSLEEREIWEVVRGVEEGRADIGVCWDAVDLRRLKTFPYHHDHLCAVLHPNHPLAKRRTLAFEDTIDYEHVDIVARSIMKATQRAGAAPASACAIASRYPRSMRLAGSSPRNSRSRSFQGKRPGRCSSSWD